MKVLARAIKLLLFVGLLVLPADIIAQSKPAAPSKTNSSLTDQEKRGQHLFLQRCSVCHLPKYGKADPAANPPFGPKLEGLFKGSSPAKEKALRDTILKGTQNMPGFQYALGPKEVDDLIAYLKTL